MKNGFKQVLAGAAVALSAGALAGPITWEPVQNTAEASDVIAVGDLIEAFNATSTSSAGNQVVVNGVQFTNTGDLLSLNSNTNFLGTATSGDADYDSLLSSLDFGGGSGVSQLLIGGGSLQSGSSYLLQVWFTDLRVEFSARNMIFGDGQGNNVSLNASGSAPSQQQPLGQFAIGTFTASAATQTLTLKPEDFGNSHITAYQVRSVVAQHSPVPSPTPLVLLALGLSLTGGFLRRARA